MITDYPIHDFKRGSIRVYLAVLNMLIAIFLPGCSDQTIKPDIANHLVVMVDASGSYRDRQADAVERAIAILDSMSKTKLKRWESQSDKIFVISLDASPDTIWQGTLKDLKAKSPAFWKERFVARTDYAFCTDVTSAFRLAAKYLEGDSRYISKYLFVFSDLIHEPPTGNMRSCQFPVKVSPDDFPWSTLSDVSVSIFWLPTTQKLLWRKAIQEHGMEANFSLYTTSESSTVAIPELPRPQEKVTAADRKAQQAQIKNAVASSLLWIFVLIIVFSLLIICGFIFQRYRRRDAPVFNNNRRPIPVPPRPWPGNRPRTPVIPKKRS